MRWHPARPPKQVGPEEEAAVVDMGETFVTYDRLRAEGRDTIWSYVARNLSRPLSMTYDGGWANVLIGNPPWVAFRHMSADLQKRFRELAQAERVYVGGKLATQNDLSALFTVRAAGFYLRPGGRLAFVLPLAALTRGQFDRFRSGDHHSARLAYDEAWTMDDTVQPLFPVPSCVVFARRRATATRVPDKVRRYAGGLPYRDAPEQIADARLIVTENAPAPAEAELEGGSAYRKAFRQGATLVPRMLCFVERKPVSARLGVDAAMPLVASRRSPQEKAPWKALPGVESKVEVEFLHPVLLGESILPYRVFRPFEAVVPVTPEGEVLDAAAAAKRRKGGLADWMRAAEKIWEFDRPSPISLIQQFDYYGKLASQFPLAELRVAYAKAGTQPAAVVIRDPAFVLDHKLYWTAPASEAEARYLAAILNCETARARIEAIQSRGQWGARDFDKVMFTLPIPRFDPKAALHKKLAAAAAKAEKAAAAVDLPDGVQFQRARSRIRTALIENGIAATIDGLVGDLLAR
jgi:hypothetical protein